MSRDDAPSREETPMRPSTLVARADNPANSKWLRNEDNERLCRVSMTDAAWGVIPKRCPISR